MGDHLARGRLPFRRQVLFEQTARTGVGSVPLVAMVSFFLGLTMALLTGYELRTFGMERLVPELVATAFCRELGPLMTGIVLAARIGAAYTAELGTMTVSEEVEAIEAMGIGPLRFLVGPRLTAIVACCPCLVVVSNLAALVGGYLICITTLNIACSYFIDLVHEGLLVKDIVCGHRQERVLRVDHRAGGVLPRADGQGRRGGRRRGDDFQRRHVHHDASSPSIHSSTSLLAPVAIDPDRP